MMNACARREVWGLEGTPQPSPGGKEDTVIEAKTASLCRFLSLVLAFFGYVVMVVPMIYPLTHPVRFILLGSGVTVVATIGYLLPLR